MFSAHIMVSLGVLLNECWEKKHSGRKDLSPPQKKLGSSVSNPDCKGRYWKNP